MKWNYEDRNALTYIVIDKALSAEKCACLMIILIRKNCYFLWVHCCWQIKWNCSQMRRETKMPKIVIWAKFIALLLLANQMSCSQLCGDTKMTKVQNWANFILKSFSLKWLNSFYSDVLLVLVAILTRFLLQTVIFWQKYKKVEI